MKYKIFNLKHLYASRAFSLIELLIVITVAGVILLIVAGSFSASRAAARDLRRISDIKQIQLGLALYFDKYRYYPPSTSGTIATDLAVLVSSEKVLPNIPTNPQGSTYLYSATGANPKTYCIGAKIEGDPNNFDGQSSCTLNGSDSTWYKAQNPR